VNRSEIRYRLISTFLQADGPVSREELLAAERLKKLDVVHTG